MKPDLKKLLSKFTTEGIENGDLVITFEIHRVKNAKAGTVVGELPKGGQRIMSQYPGQQGYFKLKKS